MPTTQDYSSTTLYYEELLSTYYSSTSLYYKVLLCTAKVLLQYYSVLQSTTPVLVCNILYYKVLLFTTKNYSVLQSTTPELQRTKKKDFVLESHKLYDSDNIRSLIRIARSNL